MDRLPWRETVVTSAGADDLRKGAILAVIDEPCSAASDAAVSTAVSKELRMWALVSRVSVLGVKRFDESDAAVMIGVLEELCR